MVFLGDMNVQNEEWLHSVSGTDHAGVLAQEFSEMFNMHQLVDFPTRGQNTLDLVLSDIAGSALSAAGFGTSDHKSMYLSFTSEEVVPKTPIKCAVRDWHHAPWPHIKGALKRAFKDWRPNGTVEEAEDEMDTRITGIIDKYVKFKQPAKPGPTPWWNSKCEKACKWKSKCFMTQDSKPDKYKTAVKFNRKAQKKAYGAYQRKIKSKLNRMPCSDGAFWKLAKEIGGLEPSRSEAAPSAQDPCRPFRRQDD